METRKVWLVSTNTDLTEGRGNQYTLAVCELETTAYRLAKNAYVQGSDAPVRESELYWINGQWYQAGPNVVRPTDEDRKKQDELDFQREVAKKKENVLERARALGLTDDEIDILRQ